MRAKFWLVASALVAFALTGPARAGSTDFFFSTGNPDGLMATASRPSSAGKIEIESADDFVLTSPTSLTSATFTGLIPTGLPLSGISDVRIEIYRVFPNESDVGRTSGPPTFSTPQVPTRVNSPSDVELDDRSASANTLKFTPGIIQQTFTANNSVLNGIHPIPGFHTGGDGSVTGQEVQFNVLFTKPFNLPADHYFFVPQVQLTSGDFFWLSAPGRSSRRGPRSPPAPPTSKNGFATKTWHRTGCESGRTSSAERRSMQPSH